MGNNKLTNLLLVIDFLPPDCQLPHFDTKQLKPYSTQTKLSHDNVQTNGA